MTLREFLELFEDKKCYRYSLFWLMMNLEY